LDLFQRLIALSNRNYLEGFFDGRTVKILDPAHLSIFTEKVDEAVHSILNRQSEKFAVTSQKLMAQAIEFLRKLRNSIACAMSFENKFFI